MRPALTAAVSSPLRSAILGSATLDPVGQSYGAAFRAAWLFEEAQVDPYGIFAQVADVYQDASGNGNHLSIQGWNPVGTFPRETTEIVEGSASLEFEAAVRDHLYKNDGGVGHDTNWPGIGTDPFTIAFWIYSNNDTDDMRVSYIHSDTAIATPYDIIVTGSGAARHVFFSVLDSGDAPQFINTANGSIPLNTWTHVACVWTGSILTAYINGVADPATDVCTSISNQTTDPEFKLGFGPNAGVVGFLDEVCVFTAAVSPEDIARIVAGELITA